MAPPQYSKPCWPCRYLILRRHLSDSLLEVIPLLGTPHTLLHSRVVCHTVQLVGQFLLDVTVTWLTRGQVSQLHKIVLFILNHGVLLRALCRFPLKGSRLT